MILRCAACMSSGSARVIAFSAASRSPLLIASSTIRTAPRIWGRRDLLIMVRRAILRVAFLAEVVLAMLQISFDSDDRGCSGLSAPAVQPRERRCYISGRSSESQALSINRSREDAPARKKGAELSPPPLAVL